MSTLAAQACPLLEDGHARKDFVPQLLLGSSLSTLPGAGVQPRCRRCTGEVSACFVAENSAYV